MEEDNCQFCQEPLQNETPLATMPCGHQVHTQCYVQNLTCMIFSNLNILCSVDDCEEAICPYAWYTEGRRMGAAYDQLQLEGHATKEIEETCPKFLEDIEKFRKLSRERAKANGKFQKRIKEEKKQFGTETSSMMNIIKGLQKQYTNKVRESQEYKDAVIATAKTVRARNKLMTDWNLSRVELSTYLNSKKIKNSFAYRWRYNPKYAISRAFRIYLG